jgi:flagellin-like protein
MKRKTGKKGISNIIGYILLIAIVIALSVLVYGWLKTYVPSESIECRDGVSVSIDRYEYDCNNSVLNLTLKNSGRFDISGFYIYGRTTPAEGLATTDLSPFTSQGNDGVVLFDDSSVNVIDTNTLISSSFYFNTTEFNQTYSIDIVPVRYQRFNGKDILVNCGNSRISEAVKCSSVSVSFCGNDIKEQGETCDGTDLNSQTCSSQGFTGGTLSCNSNCLGFNTGQCTISLCGNGVVDSSFGETCDDGNTNSSDGCSAACQVEFGYVCSGTPSVCTGLGVFNATYSNLCKDCGSNPNPDNCIPSQGCHWWYYDVTLQELGNKTGITVNSRQKCYDLPTVSDFCDPVKTTISEFYGTNHINQGSNITNSINYIWTTDPYMFLTETFNGTDDSGHFVTSYYSFNAT